MYTDVEVRKLIQSNRDLILSDISRLVSFESPSSDADQLNKCADFLLNLIGERTGIRAETIIVDGQRIILAKYGKKTGKKPIAIVGHYDTVHPVGSIEKNTVAVKGDRMTGPGIFDMKAGIIVTIWGLKYLLELGSIDREINVIITFDEELGSKSSRDHLIRLSKGSAVALVMEPSAAGKLKVGRKGVGIFTVTVKGVASHAGLDPEKGASAISELARLILEIESLQDRSAGTTVSVGIITGGGRSNVVPDLATATVDVRAKTMGEAERIEKAFHSLRTKDPRTSVEISGSMNRPPMEADEKNLRAFDIVHRIGSDIGIDLESCEVGGASDGNYISASGVPVVDGFGTVGDGAHSLNEYISVDQTLERIRLLTAVLSSYP